jgi:hypothetical protein
MNRTLQQLIAQGFVYNQEGENDLMEGYVKFDSNTIEMYSNGEDENEMFHIIMNNDGDVLLEETVTA